MFPAAALVARLMACCFLILAGPEIFAQSMAASRLIPGQLYLKFKPQAQAIGKSRQPAAFPFAPATISALQTAGPAALEPVFPSNYGTGGFAFSLDRIYLVKFNPNIQPGKLLRILRKDPAIEYAEPVYVRYPAFTPNDSALALQGHLAIVQAFQAWEVSKGHRGILIAIVDTGVDWEHPDLEGNIWRNPNEIADNNVDDDGNGLIDDVHGWDFAGNDNDPKNAGRSSNAGHGTHVAGLAGAVTDNGIGVAGVAFQCRILPVKASYDATLDPTQAIIFGYQGLKYAADMGADIINLSWGGQGASQVEQEVINYAVRKGALIVAAAGNENSKQPFYPAAYDHVLAVAATDSRDRRATFSNYGPWVDLSAPGLSLYSTWPENGYTFLSGSSMAAPVVSGAAALVKTRFPDMIPDAIIEQLRQTADDNSGVNPGFRYGMGKGRLNAYRAVTELPAGMRLIAHSFSDSAGGDGDETIEPGEKIQLFWRLANYLTDVSQVRLELSSSDPFVEMISPIVEISRLAAGDTLEGQPFAFRISPAAPSGHLVDFLVDITAPGFSDFQMLTSTINPLYADFVAGNIATTISSFGAIGFEDYAGSGGSIGLGFQFPPGTESVLFHGSFMVANGENMVSDVAYGNTEHNLFDFQVTEGGMIVLYENRDADLQAEMTFSDAAAENPIGLQIREIVYGWNAPPRDDFIILEYHLQNTGETRLENLYAAQYADWDVGDAFNNFAAFDTEQQLGFIYADSSRYFGLCAVAPSRAAHYSAIKNPDYVWPPVDFPDHIKYRFMKGEINFPAGDEPSDWSHILSLGPFALEAGATRTVAFAMVAGESLDDIRRNAATARQIYATVSAEQGAPAAPVNFSLMQNVPNPFMRGSPTKISFTLPVQGEAVLTIYNILGQVVTRIGPRFFPAGRHEMRWDGTDFFGKMAAPGLYFYRVRSGAFAISKKLLIQPGY